MTDGPTPRKIVRTLDLTEPIHDAGKTISKLEFSKPKARIFKLIDDLNEIGGDQVLAVIGDLCAIGPEAVDEMDWDDAAAASAIVGELLNPKKKSPSGKNSKARKGGKRK